MNEPAPLIVTAELPTNLQKHFDDLRTNHFPKERNFLGAHLTLFHALPGAKEVEVGEALKELAAESQAKATVAKVMSLGKGVAFRVESPELKALRQKIATRFEEDLTSQDKNKGEFHITVQNKVTPEEARALLQELQTDFEPIETTFVSLTLWRYLNGPWEKVNEYLLRP